MIHSAVGTWGRLLGYTKVAPFTTESRVTCGKPSSKELKYDITGRIEARSLISRKSTTRNPQLKVPPGGLVGPTPDFYVMQISSISAGIKLMKFDPENSALS